MKILSRILIVVAVTVLVSTESFAQGEGRTEVLKIEKHISVDAKTGVQTVTFDTIYSTQEDITVRNNIILINPLKFILYYNLSYLRRINPSLMLGGGVQIPTIRDLGGFGVNAEVRLHPSGKAPRGFYFAPNISYNLLTFKSYDYSSPDGTRTSEKVSGTAFSVGGLFGWQWFPSDEFAIGLGIGADYYFFSGKRNGASFKISDVDGIVPALRLDIGYAW